MSSYTIIESDGSRREVRYNPKKSKMMKVLAERENQRKTPKGKPILMFGLNTISR
jgi:hypothetical protein